VSVIATAAGALSGVGRAAAHGAEVNIAVTCTAPDPGRPLDKVCNVILRYPDGDPVVGADVELTAVREGNTPVSFMPVRFRPVDEKGLYSATASFPAYGRWRMKFAVRGPGSGEAELLEELLPPAPGASPEVRARLQVVFGFSMADVRNIALRVAHLVGAISWFALSALVLVASLLPDARQRGRLLSRLTGIYPWSAGAALLLLSGSGALSARYNTPTRPPGLFAPDVFSGLPFGEAYLMTFVVKLALGAAILGATLGLALSLRRAYATKVPAMAGSAVGFPNPGAPSGHLVTWLSSANVVLGLLVFVDVVVMGYLHVISHVGAAAAAG